MLHGDALVEGVIGVEQEGQDVAPVDSDLDYFLALEPALTLGFDDPARGGSDGGIAPAGDPEAAWVQRFGALAVQHKSADVHVVAVNSTPRLGSYLSIALISPIVAVWIMSSSGSPRLANRFARL